MHQGRLWILHPPFGDLVRTHQSDPVAPRLGWRPTLRDPSQAVDCPIVPPKGGRWQVDDRGETAQLPLSVTPPAPAPEAGSARLPQAMWSALTSSLALPIERGTLEQALARIRAHEPE